MFRRYYEKAKHVIMRPSKFFAGLHEAGVKEAFKMYVLLSFISLILGIPVSYFMSQSTFLMIGITFPIYAGITLAFWAIGLPMSFVFAGIFHLWIKLFGGKAKFHSTYQLGVYSGIPGWLVSWVPFVGFVGSIYSIVLGIIGVQKIHHVSKAKAIWIYLLPVVIGLVLIILGFAMILLSTAA